MKHSQAASQLGITTATLKDWLNKIYITSSEGELRIAFYNQLGDVVERKKYIRKKKQMMA